jgi:hypothetical protein
MNLLTIEEPVSFVAIFQEKKPNSEPRLFQARHCADESVTI